MIKIKEYFPKQLKNMWLWLFFIIGFIVIYIFNSDVTKLTKLISLGVLVFFHLMYNLRVKFDDFLDRIYWFSFIVLCVFSVAFYLSSFDAVIHALAVLLFIYVLILLPFTFYFIKRLWELRDYSFKNPIKWLRSVLTSYLFLSVGIVAIFVFLFLISGLFEGNGIISYMGGEETPMMELSDLAFYSGSIYYLSVFGDMIPQGVSRWITLFAYLVSYVVLIVLLGVVVSSFVTRNNKENKAKNKS